MVNFKIPDREMDGLRRKMRKGSRLLGSDLYQVVFNGMGYQFSAVTDAQFFE